MTQLYTICIATLSMHINKMHAFLKHVLHFTPIEHIALIAYSQAFIYVRIQSAKDVPREHMRDTRCVPGIIKLLPHKTEVDSICSETHSTTRPIIRTCFQRKHTHTLRKCVYTFHMRTPENYPPKNEQSTPFGVRMCACAYARFPNTGAAVDICA